MNLKNYIRKNAEKIIERTDRCRKNNIKYRQDINLLRNLETKEERMDRVSMNSLIILL